MNSSPLSNNIEAVHSQYLSPLPLTPPTHGIQMPETLSEPSSEKSVVVKPPMIRETTFQKVGHRRPLLLVAGGILGLLGVGLSIYGAYKNQTDFLKFGIPLCIGSLSFGLLSQAKTGEEKLKAEANKMIGQLLQAKPLNKETIEDALTKFISQMSEGRGPVDADVKAIITILKTQIKEQIEEAETQEELPNLKQIATHLNEMIQERNVHIWKEAATEMLNNLVQGEDSLEEIQGKLKIFIFSTLGSEHGFILPLAEGLEFINEAAKSLSGAKAKDIALLTEDVRGLFTLEELKTGKLMPPKELSLVQKVEGQHEKTLELGLNVPSHLDGLFAALQKERLWRLQNLKKSFFPFFLDQFQPIQHKDFPDVKVWLVGALPNKKIPFEIVLAQLGQKHNILVMSNSSEEDFTTCKNTMCFKTFDLGFIFPQDVIDFSAEEIRIPASSKGIDRQPLVSGSTIEKALNDDRDHRFGAYATYKSNPNIQAKPTNTFASFREFVSVGLAKGLDVSACMSLTCCEGGNTLVGHTKGDRFIIIGKDSLALSKFLMEIDLGEKLSEKEMTLAFSIDYGIAPERVFFVEQPGDFHLDMNMALLGGNVVVINDAIQAAECIIPCIEELNIPGDHEKIKEMTMEFAKIKKEFEDQAARELKQQGFKVIRFPGKFSFETPSRAYPVTNFFNFISATTPEGKRIIVAMGCPELSQVNLKELFSKMVKQTGVEEIVFLDPKDTHLSLLTEGGISCRTKPF